jgi:hypothetical protein
VLGVIRRVSKGELGEEIGERMRGNVKEMVRKER